MTDSLRELTSRLVAFREARDWQDDHQPVQLAQSVVIEAAELLECFQWGYKPTPRQLADEIADVTIYLLNLAEVLNLDLGLAIERKINLNEKRFPALSPSGIGS